MGIGRHVLLSLREALRRVEIFFAPRETTTI